jgi:hypothetical protein
MCSRHDAVQLEPPEGGSAAEPGLGGLCQLVRIVRRRDFAPHEHEKAAIQIAQSDLECLPSKSTGEPPRDRPATRGMLPEARRH